MEIVDIAKLYKHIKKHFPFFDASIERVKEDHKYLKSFPAEAAAANIDAHILTETVTPGIAHIRGRLGEMMDSERSKKAAAEYNDQLEAWEATSTDPPEGYWDNLKKILERSQIS